MTLISLLLVLAVERITTKTRYWQSDYYFNQYITLIERKGWLAEDASVWKLIALVGFPVLLLVLLLQQFPGTFWEFVVNTLILMVCMGDPAVRATYKCYLQAANRGDMEACDLYAREMGGDDQNITSFGQVLVWENYRHYAAVLLWFVVFASPGVVAYVLMRGLQQYLQQRQHPLSSQMNSAMAVVDWLPVRITSFGFMLVGHFSRALPVWLGYLPDMSVQAKTLLAKVSRAAEEIEPDESDCTAEPCTLVRLAKRNMMFLLVLVSVLTLAGVVN